MKAEYINHYLSDNDVANFARQSFGKLADEFSDEQNNNLVRYLARGMASGDWEKLIEAELPSMYAKDTAERRKLATYLRKIPEHWVPFGHPQITLRMSAPVPITVQCYKHKIGFVESGESRRYISSTPKVFIPEFFRAKAENVKQGSAGEHTRNDHWSYVYKHMTDELIATYEAMIADGVCPEQARFILPQGTELNWVWTGSLYAFANAYNQRSDAHAQKEIQDLFAEVDQIIDPLFPVSWSALTQGKY